MSLLPIFSPYNLYAPGTIPVNAVHFDGASDTYVFKTNSLGFSLLDSQQFTLSCWVRFDSSRDDLFYTDSLLGLQNSDPLASNNSLRIFKDYSVSTNRLSIQYLDESETTVLNARVTDNYFVSSNDWIHILISVDMSSTSKRHIYVDDSIPTISWSTYDNNTLDFSTMNRFYVGARSSGAVGAVVEKHYGDLAEVWFYPGLYLDFSTESNRRLFIDSSGKPTKLGSNGQYPTGNSPFGYFSGKTSVWHVNRGTGPTMSKNGNISTASSSPSD